MTTTQTSTRTIDGIEIEVDTAECTHCGEPIARTNIRGGRSWRHVGTFDGMCVGGGSCADPR